MIKAEDYTQVPEGLPTPEDDGGASHLVGLALPEVTLPATDGTSVEIARIDGTVVLFCYPMTGRPGAALPDGWDSIPGARGCTPQACSYRDSYSDFVNAGAVVYGVSTQSTPDQREAAERLHLPFPLLSDEGGELTGKIHLPTFEADGKTRLKRLTIAAKQGRIAKVWYPIFPSNSDASVVLDWLRI